MFTEDSHKPSVPLIFLVLNEGCVGLSIKNESFFLVCFFSISDNFFSVF